MLPFSLEYVLLFIRCWLTDSKARTKEYEMFFELSLHRDYHGHREQRETLSSGETRGT